MKQKQSGSGLIFAVVLLFVILGMVVTLSSITVLETKMNQKTKSSVGAFYNSESGVEWALNKIATSSGTYINDAFGSISPSDHTVSSVSNPDYKVYLLDKDGKVIINGALDLSEVKAVRSVGSQGGETQRAIEAAVAAGGSGCYVSYKNDGNPCSGDGCCLSGFTNKGSAGKWGVCGFSDYGPSVFPPGGNYNDSYCEYRGPGDYAYGVNYLGEAYVCCL